MAADPLSRLSGLSATSEWIAGAALVVYGAVLYAAARYTRRPACRRRRPCRERRVRRPVAVVLIAGWLPLTGSASWRRSRSPPSRSASPMPSTSECAVWCDSLLAGAGSAAVRGCGRRPRTRLTDFSQEPPTTGKEIHDRHHHPPLKDSTDSLLRFAMRADAVITGVLGIAGVALAGWLAEISGTTHGDRVRDGRVLHRLRRGGVRAGSAAVGAQARHRRDRRQRAVHRRGGGRRPRRTSGR